MTRCPSEENRKKKTLTEKEVEWDNYFNLLGVNLGVKVE